MRIISETYRAVKGRDGEAMSTGCIMAYPVHGHVRYREIH